jgi:amino acid transporter
MHKSQHPVGFWSAVSMGVGAMVGAGIFALLGEAGSIAGSAVYISFILGGLLALLSGYSLGKLGARYPSSGGIIEYLAQSYGSGTFTGSMGIVLYFTAVVSLSLIAKAFGNYATAMLQTEHTTLLRHAFSVGIVCFFVVINLKGATDVALLERVIVAIKLIALTVLSVVGILYLDPSLLDPGLYPGVSDVLSSLAITFFAYEGFRVITNTAEDMPNPQKDLPRSIIVAILIVMLLYIAVSFAVFGNLSTEQVVASKDYALAQAATPIFGHWAFNVVAIAALISTASSINANLYAVTNITYQLAKDGELPAEFGKPIAYSREGVIISGMLVILLALLLDLSEIAAVGSISILLIHAVTHIGHLRVIDRTQASRTVVALAAVGCLAAMVLAMAYVHRAMQHVTWLLVGLFVLALLTEIVLQTIHTKEIQTRIET